MNVTDSARTAALLQGSHLFGWLAADRVQALAAHCARRLVAPGDDLCRRGEPCDGWFLVEEGTARITDRAADASLPPLISAGDSFGACALLEPATWPATLRAETGVAVLACSAAAIAAGFSAEECDELKRRAALEDDLRFLRGMRVFAQLPPRDVERILEQAVRRRLPRGEHVFREDEAAASCFILRQGRIQLLKTAGTSRKHLAVRRAGDLIGEIELLYGTPRMADAVAATDIEVFEMPQAAFDALIPDGRCREAIFNSATDRLLQYQNALAEVDRRTIQEQLPTLDVTWVTVRQGLRRRSYPLVAVDSPAAVGVACLAMLDRRAGRESSWDAQLEPLLADGESETLISLSRKADECGYLTRVLNVEAGDAARLPLPVIIEDELGAPAVLFDAGRRPVIGRPRHGLQEVARPEFVSTWRGTVLIVTPMPARPLQHVLRASAAALASIAAAALVVALSALAMPLAAKLVVDRVIVDADRQLLRLLGVALATGLAFRVLGGLLREQLLVHVTKRAVLFLQLHFLDHLLRLPLGLAQRAGDAAGFRHTDRLVDAAVRAGLPLLVDAVALVIALLVVFALSPSLAGIAILFVASYAAITLVLSPRRRREAVDPPPSARGYLIELVAGIRTVKALASESFCTARGTRLMLRTRARELDLARIRHTWQAAGVALHFAAMVAVLGYGASLTLAGAASAGDVVAVLAVVSGLIVPVQALLEARSAAHELRQSMTQLNGVLNLRPEVSAGGGLAPKVAGHVRLTDLRFRYAGTNEDALSDVNLEILPGQKVALVGRSGSGKTTLVNLIVGLYAPTSGTIHIDGTDLAALPKPALRRQLGIVEQQPFLFDATVADNISRGDPSVTREQVVRAAQLAGAHGFISLLPQGYDTPVGERGARWSGGERQRLTIARALVANPRLIVLDEATSALDSDTEHQLYDSLQEALAGRTMIIIAHRLSTVRHADVIVVLDRGRIVEVGSDHELMARRGLYYYLETRTV